MIYIYSVWQNISKLYTNIIFLESNYTAENKILENIEIIEKKIEFTKEKNLEDLLKTIIYKI